MKPTRANRNETLAVETARAEGVKLGFQEAAFICEGYQAETAKGKDRLTEADASGESSRRIDDRLR